MRTIKKYPNRRLYDTTESRYVTLTDIQQLVVGEEEFEVIDKRTGKDITRSTLLHVIAEQEERGECAMSPECLAHIIRAFHDGMPQSVRGYLEGSLSLFLKQHRRVGETLKNFVDTEPLNVMTELAEESLGQWLDLQKKMLRDLEPSPADPADTEGSGSH